MDICCTLVSGNYFFGAATLINSLVVHGFCGDFHVGYTGDLPTWWNERVEGVDSDITVLTVPVKTERHLGYEKAAFMLSIVKANPDCQRLCWMDADLVVTTPWSYVQDCIDGGFTVCSDVGFASIGPLHPWRREWLKLIGVAGLSAVNTQSSVYPNSGFVGCHQKQLRVLEEWAELVIAFEKCGGNTADFMMVERWRAVVGDQDLLGAALMCWDGPLMVLGAEGMGFNGLSFPFCHGVESPKAWQTSATAQALRGGGVSAFRRYFENFLRTGPIKPFTPPVLVYRRIDLMIGILIARFYKR